MTDWQIAGLCWLGLSIVLAPIVGRMIHNPGDCPACLERARKRHPSGRGQR